MKYILIYMLCSNGFCDPAYFIASPKLMSLRSCQAVVEKQNAFPPVKFRDEWVAIRAHCRPARLK